MVERSMGHYVGEFLPLKGDYFTKAIVSIELRDQVGRKTSMRLSNMPVSYKPNDKNFQKH